MQKYNADFIVVGAGVMGLTVAHRLGKRGKVAIVAPKDWNIHQSASFAAGAMEGAYGEITEENQSQITTQFCISTRKIFKLWMDEIEFISSENISAKNGTFIIGNSRCDFDIRNISAIERSLIGNAEPYEKVDPKDVVGTNPHHSAFITDALYIPNEGSFDSRQLLRALVKLNTEIGNIIVDGEVTEVESFGNGRWKVHLANGVDVSGPNVVISAGARSLKLVENLIGQLQHDMLAPFVGQGSSVRLKNTVGIIDVIRTPNRGAACGIHAIPIENDVLYLGATNRARLLENVIHGASSEEIHTVLDNAIHEINVQLASSPVLSVCSGLRPIVADNKPIVGGLGIDGLYTVTGTHRTGILMAPQFARFIEHEIDNKNPHPNNPFSISKERIQLLMNRDQFSKMDPIIKESLCEYLHPNGYLPYARLNHLQAMIGFMVSQSISMDGNTALAIQNIVNRYPAYAVPQILGGLFK